MSKERLSRIEYLRDKLAQMGHPPANRIVWEKELEKLLQNPESDKKIKGSIKPRKCPHVAWNRKLMQGYQSNADPNSFHGLPRGYARPKGFVGDVAKYILPPYLGPAWEAFRNGDEVFGRRWGNPTPRVGCASWWGSKHQKRQCSNKEVRREFERQRYEFFRLAPCVSYTEARNRFPEEIFNGDYYREQKEQMEEEMEPAINQSREQKRLEELKAARELAMKRTLSLAKKAKGKEEQWKRVQAGYERALAAGKAGPLPVNFGEFLMSRLGNRAVDEPGTSSAEERVRS